MKHKENDYLVVRSGNKNVLVLATGKTVGILANTMHLPEVETIKFSPSVDLLCVLGADPEPGASAFGVTVRPYHSLPDISPLPKMHLYGRPDEIRKSARIGVKRLPKIIDKYRLHEALRRLGAINFVQQSGSKTHSFKSKFRKEEWQDEITIFLDSTAVGEDVYNRLLYALGESVWTHLLTSKRKVRWLMTFNKLRNVHRLDKATLATLLEDFLNAGDAKDVKNVVSEDLLPFVDLVFRSIARQRSISVRELELIAQQDSAAVAELWPGEIEVAEGRPDLEKAAMKNAQSLFAYTFARHVTGIDVGKTLRKAIKNSLKEIRAD
ncbi:putative peptidase [Erwinia phage vB_EamM_Yoloswag]|uniref:Putative peptidase n=1 Tax=Erwinia phage vB_EamM_Yoloswag TaxID=1958956 RepID=A0A1S6L3C3_9CAUD|nr:peptidase [Erwinia phage vB_EamM_Yoloswag]AQT28685.1 putative peptidase [Erwinia phage vB_EamM_Yoloswag]